ncbi:hypothetical protein IGI04_023410 [Brassica rapa subsp. trilocularis]|uniref:DUF4283 domain-containing protein n=1 Tax=Brassica rapa subsp. trilocularis TaxID=1813537 RepID=A0ABQ7M5Y2_BRACM|nr:hypothetical protein IGI04_023410 [Brassica rapa subsp. trilocularis]
MVGSLNDRQVACLGRPLDDRRVIRWIVEWPPWADHSTIVELSLAPSLQASETILARELRIFKKSESMVRDMSSPQGEKKDCDVEMSNAAPLATTPDPLPSNGAPAGFLSFRDKVLPSAEAQVGADVLAQPSGSSTTPVPTDDKEQAIESVPPPPARRGIFLALRAPSATSVAPPKDQKRRCTRGNNGESSQQGGSSLVSGHRAKFVSLIDELINECGSEAERLSKELSKSQEKSSQLETKLTDNEDTHSAEVSRLEVQIGGLERDLGKTASSLLKEKQSRKAKSSEVRRLQNQIQSEEGSKSRDAEMAADVLRAEFQARLAKITVFLDSLVTVHDRDLGLANEELATIDGDFGLILTDAKLECSSLPCPGEPEGHDPAAGEDEGGAVPSLDEVVVEGEASLIKRELWGFLGSPVEQVTSCGALRISDGDDLCLLSFVLWSASRSMTLSVKELRCEVSCVAVKMLESEVIWSVSLLEAVLCL